MLAVRAAVRCVPGDGTMSRVLIGALAVATALAGIMCWEVLEAAESDVDAAAGRLPVSALAEVPVPEPDGAAEDWAATALGRPMFSAGRRPARVPDGMAPKPVGPMRLTGVVTGPFGGWATFAVAGGAKPVVVVAGAHVGDITVRAIGQGQVVVVEPDGTVRTLTPSFASAASRTRP